MSTDRITIAKTRVGILDVCRLIGMSDAWAGAKLWCPFGDTAHEDGGQERSFRIYDETNSCYCFACAKAWDPVSLYAEATDQNRDDAADALLEMIGYTPESIEDRWAKAADETPPVVDTSELADALKIYLNSTHSTWLSRQYDTDVAHTFQRCLELLPVVKTEEDAGKWLATTKRVMDKKLKETP